MKRNTFNTLNGIGLIVVGTYLALLSVFILANVWASSTLFYEFWVDWLARATKWQLAAILFAVFAIGVFFTTAGVTFFWRRFQKTRTYSVMREMAEKYFR